MAAFPGYCLRPWERRDELHGKVFHECPGGKDGSPGVLPWEKQNRRRMAEHRAAVVGKKKIGLGGISAAVDFDFDVLVHVIDVAAVGPEPHVAALDAFDGHGAAVVGLDP